MAALEAGTYVFPYGDFYSLAQPTSPLPTHYVRTCTATR